MWPFDLEQGALGSSPVLGGDDEDFTPYSTPYTTPYKTEDTSPNPNAGPHLPVNESVVKQLFTWKQHRLFLMHTKLFIFRYRVNTLLLHKLFSKRFQHIRK